MTATLLWCDITGVTFDKDKVILCATEDQSLDGQFFNMDDP